MNHQSDQLRQTLESIWSGQEFDIKVSIGVTIKSLTQPGAGGSQPKAVRTRSLHDAQGDGGAAFSAHAEPPDYELLGLLGQGGMGVVYRARQTGIGRSIALKMLHPRLSEQEAQRAKFLAEAEVIGALEHPNIVPIYDLGAHEDGKLFYAMRHIQGTPWSDVIDHRSELENLETLLRVSDAVAFAHAHRIIHRDLKPDNVMLGQFGEVLVLDWGLALRMSQDGQALSDDVAGTPTYMSPEMALGQMEDIDPRTDVYLLGGLLYRFVTGKTPHNGETVVACLMNAAQNKIEPSDRKDTLVEIALKAMATKPDDRYPSVKEFQQALRDYQAYHESIRLTDLARHQMDRASDTRKYEDYARAVFGFEEALELWSDNSGARQGLAEARLVYARQASANGDFDLALSLLDTDDAQSAPQCVQLIASIRQAQHQRDQQHRRMKLFRRAAVFLLIVILLGSVTAAVVINSARNEAESQRQLAQDREGQAITARKEALRQRDEAQTQRGIAQKQRALAEQREQEARRATVKAQQADYSNRIALAQMKISENNIKSAQHLLDGVDRSLRGWEWSHLRLLSDTSLDTWDLNDQLPGVVALTPDESHIAIAVSHNVQVIDFKTRRKVAGGRFKSGEIKGLAFSPDGKSLAVCLSSGAIHVRHAHNLTKRVSFQMPEKRADKIIFNATGQYVICGGGSAAIVWDLEKGVKHQALAGHVTFVTALGLHKDNNQVFTGDTEGKVRCWDIESGKLLYTLDEKMHIFASQVDPTGRYLAVSGGDPDIRIWDLQQRHVIHRMRGHGEFVLRLIWSADGKRVISTGFDSDTIIWDVKTGKRAGALYGHHKPLTWLHSSNDRKRLFTASQDDSIKIWALNANPAVEYLKVSQLNVSDIEFVNDGKWLAMADIGRIKVWQLPQSPGGAVRKVWEKSANEKTVRDLCASQDGSRLAATGEDGHLSVWDVVKGQEISRVNIEGRWARDVALSPDGKLLAGSETSPTLRIWNADTGKVHQTITHPEPNRGSVTAVRFTPDGRHLVLNTSPKVIRFYDVNTAKLVKELKGHEGSALELRFSPDGGKLFAACMDRMVYIWELDPDQLAATLQGHAGAVTDVELSRDQKRLFSIGRDQTTRVWDLKTFGELLVVSSKNGGGSSLALDPHGNNVIQNDHSPNILIWKAR